MREKALSKKQLRELKEWGEFEEEEGEEGGEAVNTDNIATNGGAEAGAGSEKGLPPHNHGVESLKAKGKKRGPAHDFKANAEHNKKEDRLGMLPMEMVLKIFCFLSPQDLSAVSQVSQRWKILGSDNFLWWKFCMHYFWEPESRPQKMSKNDKKKNWKEHYMAVCVRNKKPVVEYFRPETVWEEPPAPTKFELREHYKSIRSKPRDKKPIHVQRQFFDI